MDSSNGSRPLLEIKDLVYGETKGKPIIDHLNGSFHKGNIYGIVGLNGSGKSTLAHIIMGLSGYDSKDSSLSGDILFNGTRINEKNITERSKLGIHLSWQEPARYQGITVFQYLLLSLRKEENKEDEKKEEKSSEHPSMTLKEKKINEVLLQVGLKPKYYKSRLLDETLSGGERKRIELASLILLNPLISLLDEPDSGIDIDSIEYISKAIEVLRKENSIVLLITHNKYLLKICQHVYMMKGGKLVAARKKKE